jgi:Putative translation factor (SUA5)
MLRFADEVEDPAPAVKLGLSTLAMRVLAHLVVRALLASFGVPVAAPFSNPSGWISPTTPAHVLAGLSGRITAVREGGACPVGVESTIVAVQADGTARLLRPGGLAREALEAVMGAALEGAPEVLFEVLPEAVSEAPAEAPAEPRPSAPGQLASHYAPRAAVVLNAPARPAGALWLGFGPGCAGADLNLSPRGDLAEAAAGLFAALHTLDARAAPGQPIAVAPIPRAGLGAAINDMLTRAD